VVKEKRSRQRSTNMAGSAGCLRVLSVFTSSREEESHWDAIRWGAHLDRGFGVPGL